MENRQDRGLVSRVGPLEVDWPRSIGYFGAIGLAVGAGLIEPPLGIFIAAVPLLKMLSRPGAPRAARFAGQFLDGAAKPVGGDGQGTIRISEASSEHGSSHENPAGASSQA